MEQMDRCFRNIGEEISPEKVLILPPKICSIGSIRFKKSVPHFLASNRLFELITGRSAGRFISWLAG